ncbi:hypothetical protein [Bacillus sp. Marseille-P3661]|uniref:hypothetical protein n=1 Tax=Bacillus sp. Marseille-P3661 TaxID=1936234 RepID=UPI000C81E582|nr:hypothetical protein [Bacillus sp. Marseille-P3661]
MRKLLVTLISIFVLYVIYYDLSVGTLSNPTSIVLLNSQTTAPQVESSTEEMSVKKTTTTENTPISEQGLYFQEVKVVGGATVLSIVEQIQDGPLPVSINQLVLDFEELNPNVKPESIQIGKVYKFPVYPETHSE